VVIKSAIRLFQPDIVYFLSLRGIGVGVIKAAESLSIPKVFEIGDFWMKGYMHQSSGLKQRFKSLLPKRYTSQPNISPAICVSDWVANEMRESYNTNQAFTIPNATHIKSEISPILTPSTRFIFAGRIDEEKGLDLAIEALKLFSLKHPHIDFRLDIYGEGDAAYTMRCITLAEPINHKIHFRGKAKTKDEMYKSGGILLMPTRMREPFGLVIIEAMAHGCAVIASNAYGPAEIINHEENGLLFVPEDHFDLMRNIEKIVLDSDLFQTLQTNGFKHVASNYNINNVKPKVEALLEKIAGVAS
jgi:glycosyltransferase involved in cell wall biosynthesis